MGRIKDLWAEYLLGRAMNEAEHYYTGTASEARATLASKRAEEAIINSFLNDGLRHHYCARLATRELSELSMDALLALCPDDYGREVTDDHKLFVWDHLYDYYNSLDDVRLHERFSQLTGGKYQGL